MEKIVIITGGSKGLGLGLAKQYHKEGYRVISIARSKIEKYYAVDQYQCDLSKHNDIQPLLLEIFSHLDKNNTSTITLINNAGYLGTVNSLDKLAPSEIAYPIQVNLIAPLILSSVFTDLTKDWSCKKQIFNISSGAAVSPYESWSTYCSSKAGLDMMTKVFAKEQKEISNGVSMVSIYPGIVDTDMQTKVRNSPKENFKAVQRFIDFYENDELYSPQYVAEKIYELDKKGALTNGLILDVRNV
jgi:benzil reductase ((S)-benzoin forming)